MSAAARNTTEAVRLLLEHGAGQTISEKDQVLKLDYLRRHFIERSYIVHGLSILFVACQSGCTALMYAVASNGVGVETVRLLLEHGAAESINEIDKVSHHTN